MELKRGRQPKSNNGFFTDANLLGVLQTANQSKYYEAALTAPNSRARNLYLAYVQNKLNPSPGQACIMQCGMCMGWFSDGREDCENYLCPCYKFMPYASYKNKIKAMRKNEQQNTINPTQPD
jgi:hypothetical protein